MSLANSFGCLRLGGAYAEGRGVELSYSKANTLFEKACELGDGFGCFILGAAYAEGQGVKQST